jgi:DNA-binding transcriptional LysR family regulator
MGPSAPVRRADPNSGGACSTTFVTLQAVAGGLGIGIGRLPVLQTGVAAGCLVMPFTSIVFPRAGYVALVPFDASKTAVLKAFIVWLVAEGAG